MLTPCGNVFVQAVRVSTHVLCLHAHLSCCVLKDSSIYRTCEFTEAPAQLQLLWSVKAAAACSSRQLLLFWFVSTMTPAYARHQCNDSACAAAGWLCQVCLWWCVCTGKGGPGQQEQAKLWKAFLEYEKSNPQRLEQTALSQRVTLAYTQALMCLLHFPEVW